MKRFYKLVSLSSEQGGFGIHLDGKPVKTPAGRVLVCPNEKLATEVMLEWSAQEKDILPLTMPVNQIIVTAIDNVTPRDKAEKHILSYVDTDLILYRADTEQYRKAQEAAWNPWISWFENKFACKIEVTSDIKSLTQADNVTTAIKSYIESLDVIELTLFHSLVEETSSPLLTIALFEGVAAANDLYKAVLVEDLIRAEIYDEEKYGASPDQEKKRISVRNTLDAAQKILKAIG